MFASLTIKKIVQVFVAGLVIAIISASWSVSADSKKAGTSAQKPSGAQADKNTKDTSKDTKKKGDAIIDFLHKPASIQPSIR